jgi:hypothetical protein
MLFNLFRETGLAEVRAEVFAGADTSGRSAPMLKESLARYAIDSGSVTEPEVREWLRDIDAAIAAGRFLFVLPQFVVRGIKN